MPLVQLENKKPMRHKKHAEAVMILNALAIDLRLFMAKRQPVEALFTEQRVSELEEAIADIETCTEPIIRNWQ